MALRRAVEDPADTRADSADLAKNPAAGLSSISSL
jgi:hypothetical protein